MNYDRHLMTEIGKEEALMEAEDVAQAKFDQQQADYVRYLLNDFVTIYLRHKTNPSDKKCTEMSAFQYEVAPADWVDETLNNVWEEVRLNLACGDREKAGMVLVESLEEYMDEIAARAVRERNNDI